MITLDTKAKTITISSGKGGVGKTCTSVNLAILLAQQGNKVCLFDADANLANVNIMLKLAPEFTLHSVISGQKSLNDITLRKADIDIIPGASGLTDFISLTTEQQQRLQKIMRELKSKYDYLLIDNPAGINENVLSYINFSDHGIIVISPEPTSLTDAFALVRVLQKRGNKKILNVIVNNAPHDEYAYLVYKRFSAAVEKHIGCQLNYLGCVVSDEKIATSVSLQNPVVVQFPTAPSVRNYHKLSIELASLQNQKLTEIPKQAVEKKPQQPDFSTTASSLDKINKVKQSSTDSISDEKLTTEFINRIKNEKNGQKAIKEMVLQINSAYLKQFGDYAIDIPQLLHDALKMDRISKSTLQNLIATLLGLYQDQYEIPFEGYSSPKAANQKEGNLKQETAELLINLLQQENTLSKNETLQSSPKLVPPIKLNREINKDLLDSIRYASMVDK